MNFSIPIFFKFFCGLILLTSSINSLDKDDNSGEDESQSRANKNERISSIKDKLSKFSVELRQSKEREHELKDKVEKIDEALKELKWKVEEIKFQVNESDAVYERRLNQLSHEINSLKKQNEKLKIEVNAINQILKKNETLAKPRIIPFIDFHKCNKSMNIAEDEPTFTFVVTDMKKKMNQTKFVIESDIFPLKGYSMKARAKLSNHHGDLWCILSYKNSNKSSEDVIDVRQLPSVNYVFKNQSQLGHYNDVILFRENYRRFNQTFKYDTYYYEHILIRSEYDVSDTVVIEFYVEALEQAEQSCSEDGTIAWAIHDVSKKREQAKSKAVLWHASPYFYSGPKGYRMIVFIFVTRNEEQDDVGLIVSAAVIGGPYDDGLNKSSNATVTFTIFHPTEPAKNVTKRREYVLQVSEIPRHGMVAFSNEELETVLEKDTLYYYAKIEIQ